MAKDTVKVTNTGEKSCFIPNPNYNADAPPGTPVNMLQQNRKLWPGEAVEVSKEVAAKLKGQKGLKIT